MKNGLCLPLMSAMNMLRRRFYQWDFRMGGGDWELRRIEELWGCGARKKEVEDTIDCHIIKLTDKEEGMRQGF